MNKPILTDDFANYGHPLSDVTGIAKRSNAMLKQVKKKMMHPEPVKISPIFSLSDVADLCKMERSKATYIVSKNEDGVPIGNLPGGNKKREFTLEEAQFWVRKFGPYVQKDPSLNAIKIAMANFKGGVTKSTTTMSLAQGESLRGRRVLVVDLDPQGSATALCGLVAEQIEDECTIFPLIEGSESSLAYAVQKTYWSNIDLIPSSLVMFGAEFLIPSRQTKERDYKFWNVINAGLEPLLKDYDVILFDTPPSLSYVTINALISADALIIPMPPSALDFASGTHFWQLLTDVTQPLSSRYDELKDKHFDFFSIVLVKTDNTETSTTLVKSWIKKTYQNLVLDVEIPLLAAVKYAAAKFGTIYDVSDKSSSRTHVRAREAYDNFVDAIDQKIVRAWNYRLHLESLSKSNNTLDK